MPPSTSRLARTLRLDRDRARTAGRTAIASVISLCIVLLFRFPEGSWALITCIVMTQTFVGGSIDKGLMRVLGTLVACVLAVVWLAPLNQAPLPFLALTFSIITGCAYLGTGSVYPYAFIIGGVTLVMVAVLGFESQNAAVAMGLARSGEILVGVVVSWLCAFALWPRKASEELAADVDACITRTGRCFDAAMQSLLSGTTPSDGYRAELEAVGVSIRNQLALIPAAAREGRAHRIHASAQRWRCIHLERLRAALLPLASPLGGAPNSFVGWTEAELRVLVIRLQGAWQLVLEAPEGPECARAWADIASARHALEQRVEELRQAGKTTTASTAEVIGFYGLLGTLRELENTLSAVARRSVASEEMPRSSLTEHLAGLSLDRPRARYALKTGVAVCVAVLLLNLLQWESSLSAMITTFIVAQLNIGGSVRRAFLRLTGAFLGGVLALVVILFVVPYITSLHAFAVVVGIVMFFCAYAFAGPESTAYAGLQTGLAFVLVLVAGPQQETSIMPAIYRLIGVLLGTIISIGVEAVLWPSHAFIDLRDRIRQSLVGSGVLFRELANGFRSTPPQADDWFRRARLVRSRILGFWQVLGDALLEGRAARDAVAYDLPIAGATDEMMHRIARLAARFDRPLNPALRDLVSEPLDDLLSRLERTFDRLPACLDGDVQADEALADAEGLRQATSRLLTAVDRVRVDPRTLALPGKDVSFFVGLLDAVVRIEQGVSVVCSSIAREATS